MMFIRSLLFSLLVLLGLITRVDGQIKQVQVPDAWRGVPENALSQGKGYAWFRCWVDLPADWPVDQSELFLEAADDARACYVNGMQVAQAGAFPPEYRSGLGETEKFTIPERTLRPGQRQVIAVRIFYESDNRTGFNVAAPVLFGGNRAIRLAGKWQLMLGDDAKWKTSDDTPNPDAALVYRNTEAADAVRKTLKKLTDEVGPLSPSEALSQMKAPNDLEVQIALAEPDIGQPLFMTFDERGRMWVVEFKQYPNPAGLKMVSRDKFLRAVYDKVPPAPPHHFPGADRISIHEDRDGDGVYEIHKTFVEGLSLATSVAIGRGGVWVLNPPYLLFYPDRDRDDQPDADPEVHLEGFGLEDSHSIANSLRWGPDGWLYGAQGSTVSAEIRRPGTSKDPTQQPDKHVTRSLGQLIWRYHPEQHQYEIFAEGGGNTFGVEFDEKGRVFSGHNGGDTRGFHYVQGGYSQKGFGKHGPLSNPYAFGYFPPMKHHAAQRFTHNFVIYNGGALPETYRGKLFGVAPLQSHVVLSDFQPDQSSFRTKDLGLALSTPDTWCRPVDIKVGPDGCIYVADMYEQRIDHASHYQGRVDKETGRIYRLRGRNATSFNQPGDLGSASTEQLVDALRHANIWYRQTACRLLADRRSPEVQQVLRGRFEAAQGPEALELLWALHGVQKLEDDLVLTGIRHADPFVRLWSVRFACDDGEISESLAKEFADLAYREPNVEVRSQLASSARRISAKTGLAITRQLMSRDEDVNDVQIPLLVWWSLEARADNDRKDLMAVFHDPAIWKSAMVRQHLLSRVMKRFALAGTRADLVTCAELLRLAPDSETAKLLMGGFEEAFQGRSLGKLPPELIASIAQAGGASLPLRVRQGDDAAIREAMIAVEKKDFDLRQKLVLLESLGQMRLPQALPLLLKIASSEGDDALRSTAIAALQGFDNPEIAGKIIAAHAGMSPDLQTTAQAALAGRKAWTIDFLTAVRDGRIAKTSVSSSILKKFLLHGDPGITAMVRESFGDVQGATTAEMRTQIDRFADVVGQGSGNPYSGRQVFRTSCAKCHRLFDDGGNIGPDLTAYKRDDLKRMLLNVVNPSAEIREGFENHLIQTGDGRTLNGFIVEQDKQVVVLKGIDGQSVILPREEIEELRAVPTSLMPEDLLKSLTDQQVRDLFAYLRATQPLP